MPSIGTLAADERYYATKYPTRKRRVFSHITVGSNDLEAAGRLYDAVLIPLRLRRWQVVPDGGPSALCWVHPAMTLPRFHVYSPFNTQAARAGNGPMVAFLAPSADAVNVAYAAGMAASGRDSGAPGPRQHYGDGYYGPYLFDPDGNKVHPAFLGDLPGREPRRRHELSG